jgi:hypothetical protein
MVMLRLSLRHEDVWGRRYSSTIHSLRTGWTYVASFTPDGATGTQWLGDWVNHISGLEGATGTQWLGDWMNHISGLEGATGTQWLGDWVNHISGLEGATGTQWLGDWVDHISGLEAAENSRIASPCQ